MAFFSPDYLQFFIELAGNNNKDWFDLNRKRYEQNVKKPFADFIQHIIKSLATNDSSFEGLEVKDCVFRINRDIRFSKDKTPYKMMCSAVVTPAGKKSKAVNGVYIELGPEHMRVYGGVYEIDKEDLETVRDAIAQDISKFQKAYKNARFVKTFGEILGDKNKILPPHLRDSAAIEPLIFNKQWYFYTQFEPETILQENLDEIVLNCYEAGRPVESFFNELIKR
ncbi:MAG: DUF2461 domain-containing protein [Crocinitomicaceae bacterium]|jgi:uncharacterized protein (TIGR02453 family)|nr:DUF2461 domain-containing protein [Crocinitomicaceae bacterium]MCF8410386.1 DUF2461 domain-containing protein [Crocinitomicaceae bacterium]MCF8443783.1 DUF2461 domain-containing protein [Crocinitomicaceae bacterium]